MDQLSDYNIKKAYFTMGGNPSELRKFAPLISADDEEAYLSENALENELTVSARQ